MTRVQTLEGVKRVYGAARGLQSSLESTLWTPEW
jgi:hypothetical protein